ncbi:helix-turn-helix transcriptional regulator [Robertmurraya sp. FSL W8-0741]|uniref:helix-turn-helix domain-containing protein n=1 Tax=Robertmurraya sp. FSL W8-0741 TaxID=2954629 RepID=UPI0030F7D11A
MTTFTRIKKLCNERKISINELENALGYSKNTLYRLKTQTPGADKLQKIADYFNTSTDYLLGRTNNPHLDNDDEITDDDFRKIERFARNLTPNNRKKALRILEATFDDAFSKDEDDDDDDL